MALACDDPEPETGRTGPPNIVLIVIDKLYINPAVSVGIPTVLVTVVFFAGVQLLILGTVGEYLGRIFMDQSGTPQFVVRYTRERDPSRD